MEGVFASDLDYVVVRRADVPVAAGVLLRAGSRVEIPWAASDRSFDRISVNMLLYWGALARAIERNNAAAVEENAALIVLDAKTGQLQWTHDVLAAVWGSPLVADGKVYLADEDGDAVAGVDVAARAGDEHAALALDAFALVVGVGLEQLLVGESAGEDEQEGGDDEVEEDDARVVALVGLEEAAGVVGEIGLGRGHRARR